MTQTDVFTGLACPREGFYTSEVFTPGGPRPVHTFLPVGYEPNYPYPLLVFLHGHGGNEEQILRLAPRLSRRNYLCIALRGPRAVGRRAGHPGFTWSVAGLDADIEDYVFAAVEQTRRIYHVHSERIYLTGFCEGAGPAYCLALRYPERFAGLISLNGCMPRSGGPLLRLPRVRPLRVFIGHGIANAVVPLSLAEADHQLLYSAGLSVGLCTYPTNHRIHPHMLRDINRWIVQTIDEEDLLPTPSLPFLF
jgi:phospholipase/carboxylesterase